MSSGQPKTITQTTKQDNAPWPVAQPYFEGMYKAADEAFKQTNKNPFMGDFLATPGQNFTGGLASLEAAANSGKIGAGADAVQGLALDTLSGKYMMPETNPFLAATAAAVQRPIEQNFRERIIPGIVDQSIAQGAYGGSSQDLLKSQASEGVARQMADAVLPFYMANYNQERQNQLNAPGMLAQSYDFFNVPGQNMLQLDKLQREGGQIGIDNTLAKWNEQKTAPWYGLGELAQILTAGGFRTTTGTETKPNPNYVDPFTNALKIGLGGASMVAGMGGGGGFGFWGR